MTDPGAREQLARQLTWGDAHVTIEQVLDGWPAELRGERPRGLPYSGWQLLEHMRIAQRDILDFCRDREYRAPAWPDQYWPAHDPAPSDEVWGRTVDGFLSDRAEVVGFARDTDLDLLAEIPHGEGQTYLRELLLVADHNAYHLGELLLLRRLLGAWPAE